MRLFKHSTKLLSALLVGLGVLFPQAQETQTDRASQTVTAVNQNVLVAGSPDVQALLTEAASAAASAKLSHPTPYNPDQARWRDAIRLGERAKSLSPQDPAVLHFLATTYGYVGWYVRAWENWLAYFQSPAGIVEARATDALSESLYSQAGTELGFARYELNDLRGAVPFYQQVLAYLPNDEEALTWLGRIYLELNEPSNALPYWYTLFQLNPENESAAYHLELSEEQVRVGTEASTAFQEGIRDYEAGRVAEALEHFERAAQVNDSFTNAFVWAGRSSLDLEQPRRALEHWQKVLGLDPSDQRAHYFARVSADQVKWGIPAASAFYEGQTLHLQNDFAGAAQSFERAFELNASYKEAAVWAARSYQESQQPDKAIELWSAVLKLDPSDKRAKDFLRLAVAQDEHGIDSGQAFIEGVSAFESADLATAELKFKEAINGDESYAEAWGWLGRVYFTQGDFARAAGAYERALRLEPSNDGYGYFAKEARFLASEE